MKTIGTVLTCAAATLSGFGLGILAGKKIFKTEVCSCGNLRIDTTEADEDPKMFLEITDEKRLMTSKYIALTVIKEGYVSHKI